MRTGRPLKFKSVVELQEKIDEYFRITKPEEYMITGLAYHLDTSRVTLMEYGGKDEFSNAVKKGKERIEMSYEKRLIKQGRSGDIFALKNFDWKDQQHVDSRVQSENVNINVEADVEDSEVADIVKE